MKIVNCTAHEIRVVGETRTERIFPVSGSVARVDLTEDLLQVVDGIRVVRTKYSEIVGLPEPEKDTLYIVSAVVLNAINEHTDRTDCIAPYRPMRDVTGKTNACRGFRVN